MDGQRFDDFTRAWVKGRVSRRVVLRGLLGGGAALVGLHRASGPAAARGKPCAAGKRCASDADCCGRDRCNNGGRCAPELPAQTECSPSQTCTDDTGCCLGEACVDGRCKCAGTRCMGLCTDPASDALNCGECGNVCSDAPICRMPSCSGGACGTEPDSSQDGLTCADGKVCTNGVCLTAQGGACGTGTDCATGHCTDGVCCDTDCAGQCEACNLDGSVGTCAAFTGTPAIHERLDCNGAETACYGTCDGVNRETCTYPPEGTVCEEACVDGDQAVYTCDGAGGCVNVTVTDCGLYVCSDAICLTVCQDNDDCIGTAFCDAGVCTARKANGEACTSQDECASGFCVDDVCCNSSCHFCEKCDANTGDCVADPGKNDASCGDGGQVCQAGVCTCPIGTQDCSGICQECCSDADCPDPGASWCSGGTCACRVSGLACSADRQCCATHICASNGFCCKRAGEQCVTDEECCSRGCHFDFNVSRHICGG